MTFYNWQIHTINTIWLQYRLSKLYNNNNNNNMPIHSFLTVTATIEGAAADKAASTKYRQLANSQQYSYQLLLKQRARGTT